MADVNTTVTGDAVATTSESDIGDFLSDSSIDVGTEESSTVSTDTTKIDTTKTPESESEGATKTTETPTVPTSTSVETTITTTEVPIEKSELEVLKEQNSKLLERINELAFPTTSTVKTSTTPDTESSVDETIESILEKANFDNIMESKENFSKFFLDAMKAVKMDTVKSIQSHIPIVVGNEVESYNSLRQVAKDFYDTHKELQPVKKFVSTIANNLKEHNPDWDMPKILEETARVAKESLGISSLPTSTVTTPAKKTTPTLPGGTGTTVRPGKEPKKSEIDELLED